MIEHYKSPFKYDENGDNREEKVSTKFKVAKFGVFVFHVVSLTCEIILGEYIAAIWVLISAIWAAAYFEAKEG